jgi:hypothetical protein
MASQTERTELDKYTPESSTGSPASDICSVNDLYVEPGPADITVGKRVMKRILEYQKYIHHTLAPINLVFNNLCDHGFENEEALKWTGVYENLVWDPLIRPVSRGLINYLQRKTNGNGNGKYPAEEVVSRSRRRDLQIKPF